MRRHRSPVEASPVSADQPYPPYFDRSVVVLDRPSADPAAPFVVWCGECHRIVNTYAERGAADTAADVHRTNGTWHR
jgi:hypothetical protein